MCLFASVENSMMSVSKKGFEERAATVFKKKVAKLFDNVGNQLFSKLNISGIFLLFPKCLGKWLSSFWMTCLKISNFYWKGQVVVIKPRVLGYVFLLEVLHSSRWGATLCQLKIQQFPFLISKKAEDAIAFLHILLTSRKKNYFPKDQNLCKTLHYSSIFHNCAQINLYNCIVYGKKRFRCYILALNPLFSPE